MDSILNGSSTFVAAAVIFVLLLGFALVFSRLYTRASKEQTFVRTGLGGEKVIMDGGALVFPILHEIIPVNMNTLRLVVDRRESSSLITKDRMRVDVTAEFYVRVGKTTGSIASAAQTLGRKTLKPEELKALVEGKFVDALRSVAASMSMMQLHEQRKDFVSAVQEAVQVDLEKNGLELESVSLTGLDQTAREYFNENNAFDAEGLTKLTEEIEGRKKLRNDIEQTTKVAIESKKVSADKETLLIQQEGELAKIAQQKAINEQRARSDSDVAKIRSEQQQIAETAEIDRQRAIEEARIAMAQRIDIANQDKAIAISNKSKDEAGAKADAEKARGVAVRAEEQVETARLTERAEREKAIAILGAEQEAEQQAVAIRVTATAEKAAAIDRAEAVTIGAQAEAGRETVLAEARRAMALAEAEGMQAKNAAENSLSPEAMDMRLRLAMTGELAKVVEASVKPLANIDGIKIFDLGGAFGGGKAAGGNSSGVNGIVDAALSYRAQAPLVDHLISELGFEGGLTELVKKGGNLLKAADPSDATAPATPAANRGRRGNGQDTAKA